MTERLASRSVVIVGGGLTAGLVARQLTANGTEVLVLERGTDTQSASEVPGQRDELRFDVQQGLMQNWATETYTLRHSRHEPSLPVRWMDAFLQELAAGKVDGGRVPLGQWFNELVYPLFTQACYADPLYGGNRGNVFWKLIGYPGLPAAYGIDMARYRGKRHPGAADPKSIADLS